MRILISVDPPGASSKDSAECGITVAGMGVDNHVYILEDASARLPPERWSARVVDLYHSHHADCVVVERNYGGEMVELTIRSAPAGSLCRVKTVTASRGKQIRAEPIVGKYEQRRVHHVGVFPDLEDQMCSWDPREGAPSPDRVDALVWACTALFGLDPDKIKQTSLETWEKLSPAPIPAVSAPSPQTIRPRGLYANHDAMNRIIDK